MGIEFAGYAGDCRVFGRVASLGERLTDLLNAGDRVVVRDARLVSLADGHTVEVPECPVEAIFHEDNLPEQWKEFTQLNAEMAPVCPVITEKKEPLAGS